MEPEGYLKNNPVLCPFPHQSCPHGPMPRCSSNKDGCSMESLRPLRGPHSGSLVGRGGPAVAGRSWADLEPLRQCCCPGSQNSAWQIPRLSHVRSSERGSQFPSGTQPHGQSDQSSLCFLCMDVSAKAQTIPGPAPRSPEHRVHRLDLDPTKLLKHRNTEIIHQLRAEPKRKWQSQVNQSPIGYLLVRQQPLVSSETE